jgi:hypothetical protein
LAHEVNDLKHDLQLKVLPPKLINTDINNTGGNNRLRNDVKPIGSEVIPYVKGISGKFKRIGKRYIRTIFKTKYTLRNTLMRTRPMSDPQLTAHYIYNIPCECGRSYFGETGRPLSVRIGEHKFNLKNRFYINRNWPNMHSRKVIRYPGMKPRFCKLRSTVHRESTKNLPTWLAWKIYQPTQLGIPPSGSL